MKSVIFTIKSNQSLRIGEVLQADLFECYSVLTTVWPFALLYRKCYNPQI